jgi:hypothetical protein
MTSALPFPHPGLLIHFLVCGMVGNVITYVLGPKEAEAYAAIPDVPQGITPEQCAKEYVDLIERSSRAEHGGRFWAQGFAEPYPW